MEALREALSRIALKSVSKAVLSDPVDKTRDRRINVRRIRLKDQVVFQFERLTEKQAFHENVQEASLVERLDTAMEDLEQLCAAGIRGAIIGKALYEGRIDLSLAVRRFQA